MQIGSSRYDLQLGCLFYGCAGSIYKISTRKGFSFFLNFYLSSQSGRSELPVSPETEPTKWSSIAVFADSVPDSSFLNSHLFLDVVGKQGEMIYRKTIIKTTNTIDSLCGNTAVFNGQTYLKDFIPSNSDLYIVELCAALGVDMSV